MARGDHRGAPREAAEDGTHDAVGPTAQRTDPGPTDLPAPVPRVGRLLVVARARLRGAARGRRHRPATVVGGDGPSGTTPGPPAGAESPADSALRLEALLGQHAVLAADLMRGRLRNDEDFAQAANAAVGKNTDELAKLVGAVAGEQAAGRFKSLWADHVAALFNYSRGLATGDTAVRDEARTTLIRLETEIADFFSGASQGRLDGEAARAAVRAHVEHLTQQADAYAAGDYMRANASYRDGYRHTFEIGHTLATTLLPPDQAAQLDAPAWRLRSELTRLLGEHVGLALSALRAGATNSPDFPAAVQALNGNTTDVTAAVDSLFGEPAAVAVHDAVGRSSRPARDVRRRRRGQEGEPPRRGAGRPARLAAAVRLVHRRRDR